MTVQNIYERDLAKTAANFEALTPISFLGRAERVYPDYPAPLPPAGLGPAA